MNPLYLYVQEEIPISQETVRDLNIESITGYANDIIADVISPDRYKKYYMTFDCFGNTTGSYQYNKEGRLILEGIYDRNGNIIREVYFEPTGKKKYEFRFTYDENNNRKVKSMYLDGDRFHYKFVAERDVDGKITEDICTDASGDIIRKDSYLYDENNRLIKISMGHIGEWIFEYDKNYNLIRRSGYLSGRNSYGEYYEFQYNDKGLLIQMIHHHYSVTIFKYGYGMC